MFIELHVSGFLLVVVLVLVVQVRDQFVWAMRNSDPRVRIVFVDKHDSDLNSMFVLQATGCNFQNGRNLVFPLIHSFGSDNSSSRGKVHSRQVTESVNCENSVRSFVMKYCPISKMFRNLTSMQNLFNLSCFDNFSIRSPYLCNRRSLWAWSSLFKSTFVLITLGTNEELDCPPTKGFSVQSWKDSYSWHISATAPQRLNWFT